MSGAHDVHRKRRPLKMFLISTDSVVQDQVERTTVLQRGSMCQEQESGKSRSETVHVRVLDNGIMVRLEKRLLIEVPAEFVGLLEPVSDPDARLKLLNNPGKMQQLVSLQLGTPLWVRIGHSEDLAEAELKYIGPLARGSAVYFGVQLKGSAAGKGSSNGSYKGQRFFNCPEFSAAFLTVNQIRVRHWSRSNGSDPQERNREKNYNHRSNNPSGNGHSNHQPSNDQHVEQSGHQQRSRHISFLHHQPSSSQPQFITRTTEPPVNMAPNPPRSSPATQPFQIGQRVSCQHDDTVCRGEVHFCGLLPGRSSSGIYVGILLDTPVGCWDGYFKEEKLCHVPSPIYGLLLPVSKVSPEIKSHRQSGAAQIPKSILKPSQLPVQSGPVSPTVSAPKIALMPPTKPAVKPPLVPPKPTLQPPPLPPPKPHVVKSLAQEEPLQHSNGTHDLPSPLWSPEHYDTPEEEGEVFLEETFEVGSMVEVNDPPRFGVIRWIGQINGISEPVAGIELDQELSTGTDGSYLGERHFRCPPNKALFVKLRTCRRDSRFPAPEAPVNQVERCNSVAFAEWGSERVEDDTPPLDSDEARELYEGWKKGIQGHLNSCYLDATLFSLFSCCSSADWLLFWPTDPETDPSSSQSQDLLRCEIVNPLRTSGYVCASKTMALRRLLEAANIDMGFTNQEKDPEEFINKLFQLLRVEPLLKIRSMTRDPQQCHLYQLFPPSLPSSPSSMSPTSPENSPLPLHSTSSKLMRVASVQTLLESSFLHAGLKFVEAPSCLLLLMPRFGKDFKMFDAILPSLTLDITDLLDDSLRQCSICQAVAEWECFQCYEDLDITPGQLKQYCKTCNTQVHSHKKRNSHSPVGIAVPDRQWSGSLSCARQQMSLFAVTCIETSHYVSFVKHGPLSNDWLFFDSMADREGGENGFNIPQVRPCPEVGRYLSLSEADLGRINPASLKESTRRLLCDSYMCFYHSPELSLYK